MTPLPEIVIARRTFSWISLWQTSCAVKTCKSHSLPFFKTFALVKIPCPWSEAFGTNLVQDIAQYHSKLNANLHRSKDTGKSRGFAFLAYEDQKSTNLAVDNLNGSKIGGRIVTVDHVDNYKRKIAEVSFSRMLLCWSTNGAWSWNFLQAFKNDLEYL